MIKLLACLGVFLLGMMVGVVLDGSGLHVSYTWYSGVVTGIILHVVYSRD